MSRDTALVSADWAEKNLDAPGIVFVEVDEDTTAYDGGHIPGAVKLDWKTDLQDPVRRDFVNKEQFEALLSERGIGNDDTVVLYGGNNNWFAAYAYWYFKLYGHGDVKLLDGGRKKWELDARPLVKDAVEPRGHARTRRRSRTCRSAPSATRSSRPSARRTWSTCARPTSTPAACSPRRTCRRSRRSAPATSRPRSVVPWSKAANEDGTFKSDDDLRDALRRGGPRRQQGHDRVLPDRRALLAHLVRAQGAARPRRREELRRLVDRVRLAGRRAGRARRRARKGVMAHDRTRHDGRGRLRRARPGGAAPGRASTWRRRP